VNILILHSQVPFVRGGAEVLVDGLRCALEGAGHLVDVVGLPHAWNPPEKLLTTALSWRLLDLSQSNGRPVDLVICTKYPTWAASHPRKVLWLVHQHRQAYDLFGSPMSEFSPDSESRAVRQRVIDIDRRGIGECSPRYGISRNVCDRLKHYCGIDAEPLYPPVPLEGLRPAAYEPFILSVARLDKLKRVAELIAAWEQVDPGLKLKLVSDGPDRAVLEKRVRELRLESKVEFLGRVTDSELVDLYSRCRGVYYAPIDEDYGYTAVEALRAAKPVITAPDAGGVLEFVEDGRTGIVSKLDPRRLAAAINRLTDEETARTLGAAGPAKTRDLTWDRIVSSLVGG
jgi:glycosyltransferase involved in cell wall biosynthesis